LHFGSEIVLEEVFIGGATAGLSWWPKKDFAGLGATYDSFHAYLVRALLKHFNQRELDRS